MQSMLLGEHIAFAFLKMKCSIFLLVFFFVILCESNDFECGFSDVKMESVEFYYTQYNGIVPVTCSSSFSPTNITDKSIVKHLKICGYARRDIPNYIHWTSHVRYKVT